MSALEPEGVPSNGVNGMQLTIVLPDTVALETEASKIVAEGTDGSFALLPRHLDWVAPIVPGLVLVTTLDGDELIIGTDEGTLVKCGRRVMLATRRAVVGKDFTAMRQLVQSSFQKLDEQEASARSALARLESGIVRRFIELEDR